MGHGCVGKDLQGLPQNEAEMRRIVGRGCGRKQWVFRIRSNGFGIAGEVSGGDRKDGDGVGEDLGAIEEVDKIVNEGLDNEWYDTWCNEEMAEEVRGLEEENEVFLEFCWEYEKGQEEDQGQVQVQEQQQEQGRKQSRSRNAWGSIKVWKNCSCIKM